MNVLDSESTEFLEDQESLSNWLSTKDNEGLTARTYLKASDRVIARVTDGIYRQPSSAIRELISNAWDADANDVTVLTDAPRFSRIYVRDDGVGMSYETLSRLLHSIGGSAKRREEGQRLGVTSPTDPERTPGGRLIIGKIGIGLFSVSQLSRRFRISTKVKGKDYRLIAEVKLRAYSEDGEDDEFRDDDNFISGDVLITREAVSDKELSSHGTDIILEDIKPRVKDILRSGDRWRLVDEKDEAFSLGDTETLNNIKATEPQYHSGWIKELSKNSDEPAILSRPPKLPWGPDDDPSIRMSLLTKAVESEFTRIERPDIVNTLDSYLETLWTLALSVPVGYIDSHPFELTKKSGVRLFWISNETRGQAQEIILEGDETVREAVKSKAPNHPILEDGKATAAGAFRVNIDGVELKRPIHYKYNKPDKRSLENPMLFVGKYRPNLSLIEQAHRGGGLVLEGYLFWNGRVIPKENNGVLVRIRGASGALFDPTFFKYQVSEQTRLRQITSELYIQKGLDAALNIDRESFNFSHPHLQLVAAWLHRAIRQLTNKHKDLSGKLRVERKNDEADAERNIITNYAKKIWYNRQNDPIPDVSITRTPELAQAAREDGHIAVSSSGLASLNIALSPSEKIEKYSKTEALIKVLAAYDMLADRPYSEQQEIIDAILQVFLGPVDL